MTITLNTDKTGFVPTSDIGGKKGLHKKKGSHSSATLNGTGLVNGLTVSVLIPPKSHNPTSEWTGTTANSNPGHTQCTVDLTEQRDNTETKPSDIRDDSTSVSVTTPDGLDMSNVITPTVPTGA